MSGAVGIDLWLWALDCNTAEVARRRATLSSGECARADRFVHERDRMRFTSGRWRLRAILAQYLDVETVALAEAPNGKPFVIGGPVFNLSHAAGMAALVVTDADVLLGVDIEGARTVYPGLDERAFAREERAALRAVDARGRDAAFFRGWTRKEAVVKATGQGLRADLTGFAVTLDPEEARLLRMDWDDPAAWRLHDFDPGQGLAGAIACRTDGRAIRVARR